MSKSREVECVGLLFGWRYWSCYGSKSPTRCYSIAMGTVLCCCRYCSTAPIVPGISRNWLRAVVGGGGGYAVLRLICLINRVISNTSVVSLTS